MARTLSRFLAAIPFALAPALLFSFEGCGDQRPTTFVPSVAGFSKIQHIVFIIKENRTFDNYFGTFRGPDGAPSGVVSTGQGIPFGHPPDRSPHDFGHDWNDAIKAINRAKMNQFNLVINGARNGALVPYSQMTRVDIPNSFAYAHSFVLADRLFSSLTGPSFPNHLYTVAAQAGGTINTPSTGPWGCYADDTTTVQVMDSSGKTSNQFPCFDLQTPPDSLHYAGISWKYFAAHRGQLGYIWSPLDTIRHIPTPIYAVPQNGAARASSGPMSFPGGINGVIRGNPSFTGQVLCKNLENTRCVDSANSAGWAGSDVGGWIASAIADCPNSNCIVDARAATNTAASVSFIITASTTIKSGLTILLPATNWTINDQLVKAASCWNDLSIIGQGLKTNITTSSPRTLIDFSGCTTGMSRLRLSNFGYNGAATNSSQFGFAAYIWNCSQCEIDHLFISQGGQGGIYVWSTSNVVYSYQTHIHDNYITSTYGSNIIVGTNAQQIEVDHNWCYVTHRNCIDINGSGNDVHDNVVDTVSGVDVTDLYGILVYQTAGQPLTNDNNVHDNYVQNTSMECISVNVADVGAGNGIKVHHNTVALCGGASTRSSISAVSNTVGNSKGVEFSDNTVHGGQVNGIEVDGFQAALIANNLVDNPQQDCFHFNDSRNYIISGNTCRDARVSGAGTAGGYNFFSTALGNAFTGNTQFDTHSTSSFGDNWRQTGAAGMSGNLKAANLLAAATSTSGTVSLSDNSSNSGSAPGCATAASVGAACTTVVSWAIPFDNANYTNEQCSGFTVTSGVPVSGGITAKTAANITFQTVATTAAAAQYTNIRCVATPIH